MSDSDFLCRLCVSVVSFLTFSFYYGDADDTEIWVQDHDNEKKLDIYRVSGGTVTGPEPVEKVALGFKQDSNFKMRIFDLSEVNFAAVAETCRKAVERAKLEGGKVDLISIDLQSAQKTRSKQQSETIEAEEKGLGLEDRLNKRMADFGDTTITWRIWVRGSGETKYFWADKKGNFVE